MSDDLHEELMAADKLLFTTDDPEAQRCLSTTGRERERRLRGLLEAPGVHTSTSKEVGAAGAALLKGVGDVARTDKPGKNARDGFAT